MISIKIDNRLLFVNLIGLWFSFQFFKCLDSQEFKCDITWKLHRNKSFNNGEMTRQWNSSRCQSECKKNQSCLAVNIMVATPIDAVTACWFHTNETNLHTSFTVDNIDSYIKTVICGNHTGMASLWGRNGATGLKGPPGATGLKGMPGLPGPTGPTGSYGNTGSAGILGSTGATGQAGASGPFGLPGQTGSPGQVGSQGIPGYTGYIGQTGQRGPLFYIKEGCDPSWITLANIESPGSNTTNLGRFILIDCQSLCLATPSCVAVDFTSTNECKLHMSLNNLNVKNISYGTNQYVIKDRCPLNQGPPANPLVSSFLNKPEDRGAIGRTGSTGPTGLQGQPGFSGQSGLQGFTGLNGMIGFTGFYGPQGSTGSTGFSGAVGSSGIPGYTGGTGYTGQSGEIVYVRGSCKPQWVNIPGVNSPGAVVSYLVKDSIICRNLCLARPDCVAVDFSRNGVYSQCKVHNVFKNLDIKADGPSRNQFVLVSRCPLNPSSLPQNSGSYSPLRSSEDQKFDVNFRKTKLVNICKSRKLKRRSKTLVQVLIMTPIISIIINIIFFLGYIFLWPKIKNRRMCGRGVQCRK